MPLPQEITFVRHGRSLANEAQQADKLGEDMTQHMSVYDIHDFEQRLVSSGIKQAKKARRYMVDHDMAPEDFDIRYVSPFYRTLETAAYLGGDDSLWLPDVRLIERDWGHYGATTLADRQAKYPETERMKQLSKFFTRYDGGQSIVDTVYHFWSWIGTLTREMPDKRVLAVTHGEKMWAARFVLERMMPHEWEQLDADKTQRIGNCAILQYSRVNPEDPTDIRKSITDGWRRMINPIQPSKSPFGGEWQKLPGKRYYDGSQLLDIVETASSRD
jgi:broad specificity phosphatase PhoE